MVASGARCGVAVETGGEAGDNSAFLLDPGAGEGESGAAFGVRLGVCARGAGDLEPARARGAGDGEARPVVRLRAGDDDAFSCDRAIVDTQQIEEQNTV